MLLPIPLVIVLAVHVASMVAVASATRLVGLSNITQLVDIDMTSGAMKPIGPVLPSYEVKSQGLAGVDGTRGLFYFIGFNLSSTKPSVVALGLDTGEIEFEVPLPYQESALVGSTQQIAVDESTGDVVVGGYLSNMVRE